MKIIKKSCSLFLVFILIVSCFSVNIFATETEPTFDAPDVNLNEYDEDWTDDEITLNLGYDDISKIPAEGIKKYQYQEIGSDKWIDIAAETVFTENMDKEIYFRAISNNDVISKETTLSYMLRIDKDRPEIRSVNLDKNNEYLKIVLKGNDATSGVKKVFYSINYEDFIEAEKYYSGTFIIDFATTKFVNVRAYAYDYAGNKSEEYSLTRFVIDDKEFYLDSNNNIIVAQLPGYIEEYKPLEMPDNAQITNGKSDSVDMNNFDMSCFVPISENGQIAPLSFIDEGFMKVVKSDNSKYQIKKVHSIFSDTIQGWSYDAIHALAARGILKGYEDGTYRPSNNVSRAEAITMVVRLLNLPTNNLNTSFKDVGKTHWASKYIETAVNTGLITGITETEFAPDREATREEIVLMIYNALRYNGVSMNATQKTKFNDLYSIPYSIRDGVNSLVNLGIINGYPDNTLGLTNKITRAETAQMLWKTIKVIVNNKQNIDFIYVNI